MKTSLAAVATMLFANLALAQSPDPFFGTWRVTWQWPSRVVEANLQLGAEGSSWQTVGLSHSRDDPCASRKTPVSLNAKDETHAILSLRYSEVLSGCTDRTVHMHLTSPNTATGRRGTTDLVFKRE